MKRNAPKLLLLMKISLLQTAIAITLTSVCTANTNFAQVLDRKVTLSIVNQPLSDALLLIGESAQIRFAYSPDQIDTQDKISMEVVDQALHVVLEKLLSPRHIEYKVHENLAVITLRKANTAKPKSSMPRIKAETIPITGIIINATTGDPLPGVNILIAGTTRGTTSDAQGRFTIQADVGEKLTFSFIGFTTQTLSISGAEELTVRLQEEARSLSEVTINAGYYTTTRETQTGSIARVEGEEIRKQPVANPMAALIARVPGLEIIQQTGVPGGNFRVRIRGTNSIASGNDPLYIIDGVPYMSSTQSFLETSGNILGNPNPVAGQGASPLNSINPADIESIEILKDADATAIYGSRGSNGVILITTRRGKSGSTQVDLNVYSGWATLSRRVDLLHTDDYLALRREAFSNDNVVPTIANAPDLLLWDTTRHTNWQDELLGGTASITDAQLSISGGEGRTAFSFGTGYHRETTVFPGTNSDQRFSTRLNLSNATADGKFITTLSANFSFLRTDLLSRDLTGMSLLLAPNAPPLYTDDGNLSWTNWTTSMENPLTFLKRRYENSSQNLIANAIFQYNISQQLNVKVNLGFTNNGSDAVTLVPLSSLSPALAATGQNSASFSNSSFRNLLTEPQISWTPELGPGRLDILAGATLLTQISEGLAQSASGFTSEALMRNLAAASTRTLATNYYSEYKYAAAFGRINYSIANKYIINLTARRDGSSRFGPGKQFATFGAVGVAWLFSKEGFINRSIPFLSLGKIRSSYGTTGNDQLGDYKYLDAYTITGSGFYHTANGLTPARLSNPDFAWEVNRKFEIALDLGFLQNRIATSINFYRNKSSNQLLGYPLPNTTGFNTVQGNFPATVLNTGIEVELTTINIESNTLQWTSAFNFSAPRNELLEFPDLETFPGYSTQCQVGEPLSIAKLYHFTGLNPNTGQYSHLDANNDGSYNVLDRQTIRFLGTHWFGGLNNTLRYKSLQLDFLFQFVKQTGYDRLFGLTGSAVRAQHVNALNRWQQPGDETIVARAGVTNYLQATLYPNSDQTVTDASFIRLKNVALSFSLPAQLASRAHMRVTRFYVQGQNLLTFTAYNTGLDPETRSSDSLPPLQTLTLGLQLTF